MDSDGGPRRELGGSIFDGGMSLGERTVMLLVDAQISGLVIMHRSKEDSLKETSWYFEVW